MLGERNTFLCNGLINNKDSKFLKIQNLFYENET